MNIKVLGPGCANCTKLEAMIKEVVNELNVEASVEKITDIKEIAKTGVLMTPGLIIDGTVKLSGKLPSKEALTKIIKSSM